jgi:hypothetical protein
MSHHDNHQILAEAGLINAACADTRARVSSLSAEEVQHLLGTRARLEQAHGRRDNGFLVL